MNMASESTATTSPRREEFINRTATERKKKINSGSATEAIHKKLRFALVGP